MVLQTTSTMIYIGNLPIIDNDESDTDTDDAAALFGTYSNLEMVDVTNFDVDEDGVVMDDKIGTGDYVEYTAGGTPVSTEQDATIIYFATITERDGTQHNVEVSVIQMPNGDTFVNDYGALGTTDNLNIKTIELTSPSITDAAGRDTFATTENTAVCFVAGTRIATPQSRRRIERLRPGDLVETLDHGAQPVRWIGGTLHKTPGRNAPIVIAPGALGRSAPKGTLAVSPQHRVLVASVIAHRMFNTGEVLVAAKRLIGLPVVRVGGPAASVSYWHLMCARHEINFANGAPCECMLPGPEALKSLPPADRRRIPPGGRQIQLIARHRRNGRALLDGRARLDAAADYP